MLDLSTSRRPVRALRGSRVGLVIALVVALVGTVLVGPVRAASGPITVTSDYTLTSDMTFDDTGFVIAADNVTLDLGGHTITGPGRICNPCPNEAGVRIYGRSGITVKNGTINGFIYGVVLGRASRNTVQGITVTHSRLNGISIWDNSDNNLVEDCRAANNGFAAVGTTPGGGFGIIMDGGSDANTVRNCAIVNNNATGVFIGGGGNRPPSFNNIVEHNVVTGNVTGVHIHNADGNTARGNTVSNNGSGILLMFGADGNEIRGNTVNNNVDHGILVPDHTTPPSENVVIQNTFSNNGTAGWPPDPDIHDWTVGTGTLGTRNTYRGNVCDGSRPFGLCDSTAPTAAPTQSPAANGAGWNNADVTVTWNWTDAGRSGIDSTNCTTTSTSSGEGDSIRFNATCKDRMGNTGSASYAVKVDLTAPTITFSGNAETYTVDQTITITCSASDVLSGIASTSCPAVASGPATNYVETTTTTSTTLTATATDNAGNSTSAGTTFTVRVTAAGICSLTASLTSAKAICSQVTDIANAPNAAARAGQLGAFLGYLAAQAGKSIPADMAILLSRLAPLL